MENGKSQKCISLCFVIIFIFMQINQSPGGNSKMSDVTRKNKKI